MTTEAEPRTTFEMGGMGHSVKRKEDPRFIRGQGEYIDDVNLPGQLWLDIVRSPYAHATIKGIDASEALKIPGVLAVITGADLEKAGLHWMPTLAGDKQMVLPTDTVMYQSQEVAAVVATTKYIAADGVAAVLVDYEPLEVVTDPFKALEEGAPVLRPDRAEDKQNNHIWHWESGDRAATDADLAAADVHIEQDIYIPRIHVASIETCGCVADWNATRGQLTLHMTTQAPHAIRTVLALVSGLPEQNIRVKTHDIGGGFGGKVPVYPGYVLAVVASLTVGKPVKWIEDRSENLQADSFARDYHIHVELGAHQGRQDHRAQGQDDRRPRLHRRRRRPVQVPGRPVQRHHRLVRLPERVRRSRWRLHQQAARRRRLPLLVPRDRGGPRGRADRRHPRPRDRQGPGPAPDGELHPARAVPVQDPDRLVVRLGQLPGRAPEGPRHDRLRRPAQGAGGEARARRAHGHRHQQLHRDRRRRTLARLRHPGHQDVRQSARSASTRPARSLARLGVQSQGQGHETTFAQIIAEELGFPVADIKIEEGDTDTAPYGLGTYASRSTPVAGAATAVAARKIRDKARKIAAHLLEASEEDLEWEPGKFSVKGSPDRFKTIQEIAFAAYTNHPAGMEAGLEAVDYYDPPNLTFPFGSYICVVDIDKGTGQVSVRRFVAIDDCGNIINPMIVDGQIHGGLTMGLAPALYEQITYDELGNNMAGTFMDYLLPTAMETPAWETGKTITPSPHHPIGAKGVGESATVGAPPAIANAVVDALWHLGVRNIDIPITPQKVWAILHEQGIS